MSTEVVGRWFPASVVWPGGTVLRRVSVLLCRGERAGVHVFTQPGDIPALSGDVDWDRTTAPTEHKARNGFPVQLVDGSTVVVTAGYPCRCGELGHWTGPSWAGAAAVTA